MNVLIVALTNLNTILTAGGEERKAMNYPTFSERDNENINDFIVKLEKIFTVNKILNNRKHLIITSYLKGIVTNFYDGLVGIIE